MGTPEIPREPGSGLSDPSAGAGVTRLASSESDFPRMSGGGSPSPHLHALWGKTDKKGTRHPLLWHLLDTAALAWVMWEQYASDCFREEFTSALGLSGSESGRAWFAWFTAMHDLGKASPYFQCQGGAWAQHAHDAGMPCLGYTRETSHERLGAYSLMVWLEEQGASRRAAQDWARATNVDHGNVLSLSEMNSAKALASLSFQPKVREPYTRVQREIIDLVRLAVGATESPQFEMPSAPLLSVAAGMIKAADWLASSDGAFHHWDVNEDAGKYFARRVETSRKVADRVHLHAWSVPEDHLSFADQFKAEPDEEPLTPRPMQQVVIEQAQALPLGSMIVVEAPTGQGKTEAALAAALEFAHKGATGIYFALPTQATARSIHERMSQWLTATGLERAATLNIGDWRRTSPSLLDDHGSTGQHEGPQGDPDTEPSYWFRGPHRPLLSRVGVGTVDQVLLAAQPIRFGVTRLAGLAGRVVIFDEVHAYDTFMSRLFHSALTWLARLGCTVIVLSATLPSATRGSMISAYRSGLANKRVPEESLEVTYPSVTTVTPDEVRQIELQGDRHITPLNRLSVGEDPSPEIAHAVADLVRDSREGVLGVVCNTVDRAIEVYDSICARLPHAEVSLVHSRFATQHRAQRAQKVLSLAGKDGWDRRQKALHIVVGTQVIEQSLDVDFDALFTEVAPIDLVIQRGGRLHRHQGTPRPDWGRQPMLTVIEPAALGEEIALADLKRTSYVYAVEMPAIMWSSWAILHEATGITRSTSPGRGEVNLQSAIETVYSPEPERPAAVPTEAWDRACENQAKNVGKSGRQATSLTLRAPWLPKAWDAMGQGEPGSEARHRSRRDENDQTVILAWPLPGGGYRPVTSREPVALDGSAQPWLDSQVKISRRWEGLVWEEPWDKGVLRDAKVVLLPIERRQGSEVVTYGYSTERGLVKD